MLVLYWNIRGYCKTLKNGLSLKQENYNKFYNDAKQIVFHGNYNASSVNLIKKKSFNVSKFRK